MEVEGVRASISLNGLRGDTEAGLREGERMGDSSAKRSEGEDGEEGGDIDDELWLSESSLDGEGHSPSSFLDTVRFTLALLF